MIVDERCVVREWCRIRCGAFIVDSGKYERDVGPGGCGEQNCRNWRNMEECARRIIGIAVGKRCRESK